MFTHIKLPRFNLKARRGAALKSPLPPYMIWCAFAVMFIYGSLLLMVGYTQSSLAKVLFASTVKDSGKYVVYLLVAQSVGLIASALLVGKLLTKKVNIRWIFLGGFLAAVVILLLIAFINDIIPESKQVGRPILFGILSFLLGCGIGPISPLVSTLLSAVYQGKKRATMLSASNGVYGIGGGIIPLAASSAIFHATKDASFEAVRYFYFIATGLAVVGAIVGFFISYKHTAQQTSSKILDQSAESKFSLLKPLIIFVAIMSCYMIAETVGTYMFVNGAHFYDAKDDQRMIDATQAFGLFIMIQGLWRAISGLTVTKKVRNATFIICSGIVIIASFAAILGGALAHVWGIYVVAVLLGFGLGNSWPIIFSYAVSIDQRRASFIGIVINDISMFWIPVTQAISAAIWPSIAHNDVSYARYFAVFILGLVAAVLLVVLVIGGAKYFKIKHYKTD